MLKKKYKDLNNSSNQIKLNRKEGREGISLCFLSTEESWYGQKAFTQRRGGASALSYWSCMAWVSGGGGGRASASASGPTENRFQAKFSGILYHLWRSSATKSSIKHLIPLFFWTKKFKAKFPNNIRKWIDGSSLIAYNLDFFNMT